MRRFALLAAGLLVWLAALIPLTSMRKARPPAERLGYIPSPEVAYFTSLEHKQLVSELLFFRSIFYYGAATELPGEHPDYQRIYKFLDTSTRLNPYNIDSYYFGQAILAWDGGMVREMNGLLERGARKRTWDFYLPFFLGFNYSYFLHDLVKGAEYTARAAKINSEIDYLPTLASRFYYQANMTDLAIAYLKTIYKGAKNEAVRKNVLTRIDALEAIAFLEKSVRSYERKYGHRPSRIIDMVEVGMLKRIPSDPYGGKFYIDPGDGRIKTTSNLASPGGSQ